MNSQMEGRKRYPCLKKSEIKDRKTVRKPGAYISNPNLKITGLLYKIGTHSCFIFFKRLIAVWSWTLASLATLYLILYISHFLKPLQVDD